MIIENFVSSVCTINTDDLKVIQLFSSEGVLGTLMLLFELPRKSSSLYNLRSVKEESRV